MTYLLKTKNLFRTSYFLLFLSLFSCEKNDVVAEDKTTNVAPKSTESIRMFFQNNSLAVEYDLAYSSNHSSNVFDILWFKNTDKPRPLVIAIHGGGFGEGDKEAMRVYGLKDNSHVTNTTGIDLTSLIDNKIAYASINYRFIGNGTTFIDPINDCKTFVNYMKANAERYNIDPNNIILMGTSAGAEASMAIGLNNDINSGIKGLVLLDHQVSLNVLKWPEYFYGNPVSPAIQQQFNLLLYNQFGGNINTFALRVYNSYGIKPNEYITNGVINQNKLKTLVTAYCDTHKIDFPNLIDPTDPELYIVNTNADSFIHSVLHSKSLVRIAQSISVKCNYVYLSSGIIYEKNTKELPINYMKRKFNLD
jgi:acetyl esterase/lipase